MTHSHSSDGTRTAVLLTGMLLSACGDGLAAVAFSLRAAQSGSPQLLAMILLAQTVPAIGLVPLGGAFVEGSLQGWWRPASCWPRTARIMDVPAATWPR